MINCSNKFAAMNIMCFINVYLIKDTGYNLRNLRKRKHLFSLPRKDDRNFISRVLFHDIV